MGCGASLQPHYKQSNVVMVDALAPRVGYTQDVPLVVTLSKQYNGPIRVERDKKEDFSGPVFIGRVVDQCVAIERSNFEYTIEVGAGVTECIEEQYVRPLSLPELPWVTAESHEVAVKVETHTGKTFAAHLMSRDREGLYEVRFVADGTILEQVPAEMLQQPDHLTERAHSPHTAPADPRWLLDRKIQAGIDEKWPLSERVKAALEQTRVLRPGRAPQLCGPFVGRGAKDSEGYPAHPSPLKELAISGSFVDTWAKYAGKIKFATTYKIGPGYPRFDSWVTSVDAGESLYMHAALPVYAGLICLGHFENQPEWIRASDVGLVGVALYVDGELHACFGGPQLEMLDEEGKKYHGAHDRCGFIPGHQSKCCPTNSSVSSGTVWTLRPSGFVVAVLWLNEPISSQQSTILIDNDLWK
eukprot:3760634-Amphidinium_carterae.1